MKKRIAKAWVLTSLVVGATAEAMPRCDFPHRHNTATEGVGTDQRPTSSQRLRSTLFPVVVHFNADVTADYAREVVIEIELAWKSLVGDMGFLPPHPDGDQGGGGEFDVYVSRELAAGVGGYAGFSGFNEETSRSDAIGYLVIAADLKPHVLRFVVAHEFFHGVQMTYDWWEDIAFMESSANWATELVHNDSNVYWQFIPFFQAEPYLALDFVSIKNPYQYGMLMWPMFLEERLGHRRGDVLRRIWEGTIQNEMENEPDFHDATLKIAEEAGLGHINQLLSEFTLWRLLVGPLSKFGRFSERELWGDGVVPYFEFSGSTADFPVVRPSTHPLQPNSSAFLRVRHLAGERFHLQIDFVNAADFSIQILRNVGTALNNVSNETFENAQQASIAIPASETDAEVLIAISHFGERGYDPDYSPWSPNSWDMSLIRE